MVEEKLQDKLESNVIKYIKELIACEKLSKFFRVLFSKEVMLEANCDGVESNIAEKNLKTFNTFLFGKFKFYILPYLSFISIFMLYIYKLQKMNNLAMLYKRKSVQKNI